MVSPSGRYVLILQRRDLQFPPPAGRSSSRAGTASAATPTPRCCSPRSRRWGVDEALPASDGMFALASGTGNARRLTLARDRVGKKPLYYGWFGGHLLFGSELKALRAHPDFVGEIDRDALGQYVHDGWIPAPDTIHRACAGCRRRCLPQLRQARAARRPYWSAREAAERRSPGRSRHRSRRRPTAGGAPARRRRRRLVADVPLGALLSGGIDSSHRRGAHAGRQRGRCGPSRSASTNPRYDEAGTRAGWRGTSGPTTPSSTSAGRRARHGPELPALFDEPLADSRRADLPRLRLARAHVTVALSGDGGDELFLGYPTTSSTCRIGSGIAPAVSAALPEIWLRARPRRG